MTWEPTITAVNVELRQMLMTYLADQLIRSTSRPVWYGDHIPDGKRFEFLVQRYGNARTCCEGGDYQRYLCSRHWRIFRLAVMIVANGRCTICNKPADDVHHLTYERVGTEYLCDVAPLCRKCHEDQHGIATAERLKANEGKKR